MDAAHRRALVLIFLALAIGGLDAFFKSLAITSFKPDNEPLRAIFDLALHKNPGIAFDIPLPLAIVIALSALIIIFLLRFAIAVWKKQPLHSAAAIAMVIGATGNMIDRIINGFTTDYLIFFRTSAINLSDILILAGLLTLLIYTKERTQ